MIKIDVDLIRMMRSNGYRFEAEILLDRWRKENKERLLAELKEVERLDKLRECAEYRLKMTNEGRCHACGKFVSGAYRCSECNNKRRRKR